MTALLERPVGRGPIGRVAVPERRRPVSSPPDRAPQRLRSPQLGPKPASTADRSMGTPGNHLSSPWRGAVCRIRPLGRAVNSSAPVLRPRWRLELEPCRPSLPDRLVGWSGGGDPRDQIRLDFPSAEAASAWAARHGLEVDFVPPAPRTARPRPYAQSLRDP